MFKIGDKVFLKASPTKDIRRFEVRGKLSLRYIGPYEVIERLHPVAYLLYLPVELKYVLNVFHISQLKNYIPNPESC